LQFSWGSGQCEDDLTSEYSAYCHCSNCRRTTGSAFKPFAGIRRAKFKLIRGGTNLLVYGEESGNDTHAAEQSSRRGHPKVL